MSFYLIFNANFLHFQKGKGCALLHAQPCRFPKPKEGFGSGGIKTIRKVSTETYSAYEDGIISSVVAGTTDGLTSAEGSVIVQKPYGAFFRIIREVTGVCSVCGPAARNLICKLNVIGTSRAALTRSVTSQSDPGAAA